MSNVVVCLMGPTASGKTDLACELAASWPMEIISVDSAMVYRGMDIGTAKPERDLLRRAPHHLLDIIDPPEAFSAAQFCQAARQLIAAIHAQGKIPLLTGGTMMYFNALQQGLSSLPESDPAVRANVLEQARLNGWEALHATLQTIDPLAAARIHTHDTQRIARALEVYAISGKPLSSYFADDLQKPDYRFINLILFPLDRQWLHDRIARRFDLMLKQGFLEEVAGLMTQWPGLTALNPSMRCVGYRQAFACLSGEYDALSCREKGIAATRQLAKRQLTWLRKWPNGLYFSEDIQESRRQIMEKIREILDNSTIA